MAPGWCATREHEPISSSGFPDRRLVAGTSPRKTFSERRSRPDRLRRGIILVITGQCTETFASLTNRRPLGETALASLTRRLFIHLGTRSIDNEGRESSFIIIRSLRWDAGTVSKRSSPKSSASSSNDDRLDSQPHTVAPRNTTVPPRTSRSPLNSASPPISGSTRDRTRRSLLVR